MRNYFKWPEPYPDESLRGFVIRFAEFNGIGVLSRLPRLLSEEVGEQVKFLEDIAESPEALRTLARLSGADGNALAQRVVKPLLSAAEPYVSFERIALPRDILVAGSAQICPACLKDSPYLREAWDFSHVVTCSRHRSLLIDACPGCGAPIPLRRLIVAHCPRCGNSLSDAPLSPAPPHWIEVCEDAEALAPIRLGYADMPYVVDHETLFHLARILASSDAEFWQNRFLNRFGVRSLSERAVGIERLARCREGFLYRADQVFGLLEVRYEHLFQVLEQNGRRRRIRDALTETGLSSMPANIIAFGGREPLEQRAAAVYGGRPPRCMTAAEVADFLGIPLEECHALKRFGLLSIPQEDLGYDADEILGCRRFLESLTTDSDLDRMLGAPGVAAMLADLGLFSSWRTSRGRERTYSTADVVGFLDRLRMASHIAVPSSTATAVTDYPLPGHLLPHVLARLVQGVFLGTVTSAGWSAPWQLTTLSFAPADIGRIADDLASSAHPALSRTWPHEQNAAS